MPDFKFDGKTQRYRYASGAGKGQFVAKAAIENLRKTYIEQQTTIALTLTDDLLNNRISLKDWELNFAQALKTASLNQWMIARGGLDKLSNRDKGLLGARLRSEYGYLRGFSDAISKGNLTEAQIRSRAAQYFKGLNTLDQDGKREGHAVSGFQFEQTILQPGESCQSCIAESLKGIQPIGSLIPIGQRTCRAGCNCYYKFYVTKPDSSNFQLKRTSGSSVITWLA